MKPYRQIKPTVAQVARLAGVSVTTVSVFLNGTRRVCSAKTAERIEWAVQKLNYQPNPLAGASFGKERRTIGLIAGDDLERGNKPWNVYNIRIVNGIIEAANENDYSVLTYPYRVFLDQRYRALLDGRVDAVFYYGAADNDFVKRIVDAGMPVICLGTPSSVGDVHGSAHADEALVSTLALEHLWALGHRKIAHMAGPYDDCIRLAIGPDGQFVETLERGESVSRARLESAKNFLANRGALREEWLSPPNAWRNADVVGTLEQWSRNSERPTAIYCANDFIALEVIFWAREKGLRVPEDLAVIGVDNIQSTSTDPFLSSVEFEVEDIGRQAMRAFLDFLNGREPRHNHRVVQVVSLVARPSTINRLTPPLEFQLVRQTLRGQGDNAASSSSEDRPNDPV